MSAASVNVSLSSLSLTDLNAEAVIVDGEGLSTDMPFVNRHEELWQLFAVNAKNIQTIDRHVQPINNFRVLKLLFCVQYFGSGKTTLGVVFPDKVREDEVKATFADKLKHHEHLKSEWEIIQDKGIHRVEIDVRDVADIVREAAAVASGSEDVEIRDPKHAARFLIQYATDNGPTLFHFDEVGADDDHDLNKLRQLAVAVWAKMHAIKMKDGADAMPRIYFLVTGRSVEPFADVGAGHSGMGSRFLVLDMLRAEHVGLIRRHLQTIGNRQLRLKDLNEGRDGAHFDQCLVDATGGAPRLLLYTLRALHFSQASLASADDITTSVFETAFAELNGIEAISVEFLPSNPNSSLTAFRLLLGFCLQRSKLKLSTDVEVNGESVKLGQVLRFQPFFLSRDDCSDGQFVLHLPKFHLKAALKKFGSDAASMLLISMAGGTISATEAWRVFELLPAQVMASKAAVSQRLKSTTVSWSQALPGLLGNSELAKAAKFDLGSQPFVVHREKGICPAVIETDPEQFVERGGSVLPPDKSQSADLFHVQRRVDGNGHVLIEWQSKFKVGSQLNMSIVRDEVGKAAKTLDTVHIIYSATVGKQLIGAMPDGEYQVLTLRSWNSKTAAVFAFPTKASVTLLWRPPTADGSSDQWYEFPDQETVSVAVVSEGVTIVEVRPGLEVVIPHHDAVSRLVGPELFDSLKALSKDDIDNSSAVGSVITTLGEALGSKQEQKQEQEHGDTYAEFEDKLANAEEKLTTAKADLTTAKAEFVQAKASGDQKAIDRADNALDRAENGATAAQSLVTYWTKKVTEH
jgi:hypothetical protein